jgi:hypothetical protein
MSDSLPHSNNISDPLRAKGLDLEVELTLTGSRVDEMVKPAGEPLTLTADDPESRPFLVILKFPHRAFQIQEIGAAFGER